MTLILTIHGEIIDRIEMDYRGCFTYESRKKRTKEYADYLKGKHFKNSCTKEIQRTNDWEIFLSAESKMNELIEA